MQHWNLLSLVSEIAAISGVRDGHRNSKSQESMRFRCAKRFDVTSDAIFPEDAFRTN